MISPADIRARAERWWSDGSLLQAWLVDRSFCPQSLTRIRPENPATVVENYARIQDEQQALRAGSRDVLGCGYTLEDTEYQTRRMGTVRLISGISFETDADLLRYLNRETDATRFMALADQTRRQVPELEPWLEKWPLRLLDNAADWSDWLTICRYFRDVYEPDRYYVRQLPLPVHTKFLEEHSGVLVQLIGVVRPALIRPDHKDWRKRLGLLVPESMIRIRALDDALRLDGKHDDFGLPLSAFARYMQPADRIFICENLLNFLTFPAMPNSIAIWGSGFAVTLLGGTDWLGAKQLYYWGDIDVHGFQILSEIRALYPDPGVKSLLMDWRTFRRFHQNKRGSSFNNLLLNNLTEEETQLYELLLTENWRVEQEKITDDWIINTLKIDSFA